jgi:hypothetical protein
MQRSFAFALNEEVKIICYTRWTQFCSLYVCCIFNVICVLLCPLIIYFIWYTFLKQNIFEDNKNNYKMDLMKEDIIVDSSKEKNS